MTLPPSHPFGTVPGPTRYPPGADGTDPGTSAVPGRFRPGRLRGITSRQSQSATSRSRLLPDPIARKWLRAEGARHAAR